MIFIGDTDIDGFEAAIRGMRNPKNSWDKSDSGWCKCRNTDWCEYCDEPCEFSYQIRENDHDLMMNLANAGSEHSKYRRFITVTCDVIAPLYWWKEFDTYKVGTVRNSCSTMHKIAAKQFELDDFSHEHLNKVSTEYLECTIERLNFSRRHFIDSNDKEWWWQMIQLLPSSYNQRATVLVNYEVLANIYRQRKGHKLDEWRDFCKWIEKLPYSELITLKEA